MEIVLIIAASLVAFSIGFLRGVTGGAKAMRKKVEVDIRKFERELVQAMSDAGVVELVEVVEEGVIH